MEQRKYSGIVEDCRFSGSERAEERENYEQAKFQ